jgi:hypothetical protein
VTDTPITPANPDEEPTAEELAEAAKIRPASEFPSPWKVDAFAPRSAFLTPSIEALSPADQKAVRSNARSTNPEDLQASLMAFLQERSTDLRVRCGGEGLTETEITASELDQRSREITAELNRLQEELMAVDHYNTGKDAHGNPVAVAVPKIAPNSEKHRALYAHMDELARELASLGGAEGDRQLAEAARREALKRRGLQQQIADVAEVDRRAQEIARNRRLDAAAQAKARFL